LHKRGRTRASAQFTYPMPEPSFGLVPSTPCEKNIISFNTDVPVLGLGLRGATHEPSLGLTEGHGGA